MESSVKAGVCLGVEQMGLSFGTESTGEPQQRETEKKSHFFTHMRTPCYRGSPTHHNFSATATVRFTADSVKLPTAPMVKNTDIQSQNLQNRCTTQSHMFIIEQRELPKLPSQKTNVIHKPHSLQTAVILPAHTHLHQANSSKRGSL